MTVKAFTWRNKRSINRKRSDLRVWNTPFWIRYKFVTDRRKKSISPRKIDRFCINQIVVEQRGRDLNLPHSETVEQQFPPGQESEKLSPGSVFIRATGWMESQSTIKDSFQWCITVASSGFGQLEGPERRLFFHFASCCAVRLLHSEVFGY